MQALQIINEFDKINRWIYEACHANNVDHLSHRILWRFNKRMHRTYGRAFKNSYLIELSLSAWQRGDETYKETTVKHEACHLIALYQYGPKAFSHGPYWKIVMQNAGQEPRRCSSLPYQPVQKRYGLFCPACNKIYLVSGRKYHNYTRYNCGHCGSNLYQKD